MGRLPEWVCGHVCSDEYKGFVETVGLACWGCIDFFFTFATRQLMGERIDSTAPAKRAVLSFGRPF